MTTAKEKAEEAKRIILALIEEAQGLISVGKLEAEKYDITGDADSIREAIKLMKVDIETEKVSELEVKKKEADSDDADFSDEEDEKKIPLADLIKAGRSSYKAAQKKSKEAESKK